VAAGRAIGCREETAARSTSPSEPGESATIYAKLPPGAGAAARAGPTRPERSAGRADAAERSEAALDPNTALFGNADVDAAVVSR